MNQLVNAPDHLNVSEVFGGTIQGEGPNAGQLASFIRLAGCNLSCSWCDSAYTWDWTRYSHAEESSAVPVEQVAEQVDKLPGRLVVTGGEPLLQSAGLAALMNLLPDRDWDVETNGTRPPGPTLWYWSTIIASPKVGPSAAQLTRDGSPPPLDPDIHTYAAAFKFVVADQADLIAVDEFAEAHHLDPYRVWLMPEGTNPDILTIRTPWLAEAAVERGYNFTSRLHVYAWGDKRGH